MKKGISLITLIITIVVVIILAAVVILALGKNNPIDSARLSTVVNSKTNMEDCISIVASKKIAETEGKEQMSDIVKSIIDESTSEVKFTQDGTEKTIYRIAPDEFESRLGIVVKETPNKDCIWYVDNAGKVYLVFDFMKKVPNYLKESNTTLNKSVKNFVIVLDSALESSIIENIEISKTEDTVGVGEDKNITLDLSKIEGLSYSKWVINESKEKIGVDDESKYPNTVEGNSAAISLKSITNPGTYYLHVLVCTNDMKVEKISSAIVVEKKADVWDGSIAEGFASGDGTEANPYIIETAKEFRYLATNNNGSYYKIENDIDLNNIEWICKDFRGYLDGNHKKIYNLSINSNAGSWQGIFERVLSGYIKNIGVESGKIITTRTVGAITGYLGSSCSIENCYNKASIEGTGIIGGIVGECYGQVLNCYNIGNLLSEGSYCGGIVGSSYKNISNCYNIGNVSAKKYVGGIVGNSHSSILVENCYNTGEIKIGEQDNGACGGIAAQPNLIRNCYNVGKVIGTLNNNTGGIAGVVGCKAIENCYNKGIVESQNEKKTGAIAGKFGTTNYSGWSIKDNYYIKGSYLKGFGSIDKTSENTYANEIEIMPKTIIEVVNGDNAFKEDTKNVNNGYPILSWQ